MKRWLGHLLVAASLVFSSPSFAVNTSVPGMTAGGAVSDTDLLYCVQSAGTLDRKCTPLQMANYIFGKVSGDLTCTGTGGCTLKATGPGATGPIGSTTTVPVITIDANGRVTALTSATAAGTVSSASVVTANGVSATVATATTTPAFTFTLGAITPTTVNGNTVPTAADTVALLAATQTLSNKTIAAGTFSTSATFSFAAGGGIQCAHFSNTGVLTPTGTGDCGSGSGAVSSVTGSIGITCSPTTGSVVCSSPATRRDNTLTTDTITSTDKGTIVTENNASAVAVAITTAGFVSTDYFTIKNKGAGLATYTPSSGTINGAATIACAQNQSADLYFDGTNYQALGNTCQLGTAALVNTGTSGATVGLLNGNNTTSGNNTHSGSETFTEVIGGGRTVAGTTDTLAATDCGTTIVYSSASAVTVTVPQGLPTVCTIALLQSGAGKVSTNGSAVTPATQHAAGAFTGTRAQFSVINITNYTTNTVVLSGDAS